MMWPLQQCVQRSIATNNNLEAIVANDDKEAVAINNEGASMLPTLPRTMWRLPMSLAMWTTLKKPGDANTDMVIAVNNPTMMWPLDLLPQITVQPLLPMMMWRLLPSKTIQSSFRVQFACIMLYFVSVEGSYNISIVEIAVFLGGTVSQIVIGQGDRRNDLF